MAEEKKEITIPEKFKDIVEKIEKLTVLELSDLVKILEEKFGVSAVPQVVAASADNNTGAGEEGTREEGGFGHNRRTDKKSGEGE